MIFALNRHFEFTYLEIINSRSCLLPSVVWTFGLLIACNNYYYALNSHVGMSNQRKIVVGREHQLVGQ